MLSFLHSRNFLQRHTKPHLSDQSRHHSTVRQVNRWLVQVWVRSLSHDSAAGKAPILQDKQTWGDQLWAWGDTTPTERWGGAVRTTQVIKSQLIPQVIHLVRPVTVTRSTYQLIGLEPNQWAGSGLDSGCVTQWKPVRETEPPARQGKF